jgi:hypothetical protein
VSARQIIREHAVGTPGAGQTLVSLLNRKSPRNHSDPKSLKTKG